MLRALENLMHPITSRRQILALGAGFAATPWLPALGEGQDSTPGLITRPIPHSGERLPVVGLGTFVVFDVGNDLLAGRRRKACTEVVKTLVASGGSLIDTAPSYGTAESVVGDLLAATQLRGQIFLATKLEDYNRDTAAAQLQTSLQQLRTERIDLMQLHSVSNPHQDLSILREWKSQGYCRYTGITTDKGGDLDAVEAVLRREKPDFLQVNYSLGVRDAEQRVIPAAAEIGAAVLTNMPFDHDRLFRAVRGEKLPEWAADFDATSWGQFFLKYLLGNEAVTAVMPGTSNPEHMADNLGAGRGPLPDAAQRQKMATFFDAFR
jgi:aryl-alcohol dehydrogenase-like predicted oxidoreductase